MSDARPRLLIPTRNRPTSLRGVLEYLSRFYPGTGVIVADGSSEELKTENRAVVQSAGDNLAIDNRSYPEELHYFDRIVDVLQGESDEVFVMGADDDFPLMEVFEEGAGHLRDHPDCVTAMGTSINLLALQPGVLRARVNVARNITGRTAAERARRYAAWPMATTYAVTRRTLLLERYRRARELFLTGFYDYAVGVQDAMWGTTKAFPVLGFIRTHNYNHSYLKPGGGLAFLERSDLVLRIAEGFREDLLREGVLQPEEARQEAEKLILRRIAILSGGGVHKQQGFTESRIFLNDVVQEQLRLFRELFIQGSEVRQHHAAKLCFVADALRRNARSADNRGEASFYESLQDQAEGAPGRMHEAGALPPGRPNRKQRPLERVFELDPDTLLRR